MLRSGKFFTANCKNLKYVSNLVGRKQIWCGEGQNFNSLAIGRIGTDGLQWSTSKKYDNENQYLAKKMMCRAALIFTLPCSLL